MIPVNAATAAAAIIKSVAMKKLPLLLIALVASSGCASHYVITLSNGMQIDTKGKPKLKDNSYTFKDALGRESSISAGRVSQIAPASMAKDSHSTFNPQPAK